MQPIYHTSVGDKLSLEGYRPFYVTSVIWFEGFKLLYGSPYQKGKITHLLEASTMAKCSDLYDIPNGKVDEKSLYAIFLDKIKRSGLTFAEVVDKYNEKKYDIELWKISFLM